ncbi:MAG: substrate-binding domain-containing protein [Thermomicrobia bacterium]|nr:substrate-binding domain-containing protein [Thermomicrobia bacterium]
MIWAWAESSDSHTGNSVSDNMKVGQTQAQYIKDHHKKGDNVAMINGSQTDNNALLFAQGAHDMLDPLFNSGELHRVYEQYTPSWTAATAQTEMAAALTANNNIQVAYVANEGMADAAVAALKAQNLNGKVLVTGQSKTTGGATIPSIFNRVTAVDKGNVATRVIADGSLSKADFCKDLPAGTGGLC